MLLKPCGESKVMPGNASSTRKAASGGVAGMLTKAESKRVPVAKVMVTVALSFSEPSGFTI